MTPFAFATATEILFGRGQSSVAAARIAGLGRAVLLVHGRDGDRAAWLADALRADGCDVVTFAVAQEPDVALIQAGVDVAPGAQVVAAIGGGAAIDAGKAIAALIPATRSMLDHLEIVGQGLPLDHAPLPFVAIPTTAGTGAEVTRNAVIGVPDHARKVSLRDARMLPRLAIVDPALTDTCPHDVTLASGLDAITQVIEPYVSTRANGLTDALCYDAIPRGLAAIRQLMQGNDPQARDEMAWVSLCGGLALANSGLGAVHGLAGPLGGLSGAAHGAICGALLPHVLVANRRAVTDPDRIERLERVGRWIGRTFGWKSAPLRESAVMLASWSRAEGLPSLTDLGITHDMQMRASDMAAQSSSMAANPAALTPADLRGIMASAS
ncbi:iron-containing alcohol dehydrogenase [Paracoccus sp. (in: a-proteobacteria)]|uniref:iron-containing alcohol dehydrogenase n=1 Tax=Paracoccus sp. TaxID=267 RepID=UPI0026E02581|nr:iron-containing alcohol dehydrogenase [Paracoccus sp. (in: a-proteobacteria)]MDO5648891.1 iron-containing alcohol dehydrogenase [Paracoccus sp. (in: a-proteobacteria)]